MWDTSAQITLDTTDMADEENPAVIEVHMWGKQPPSGLTILISTCWTSLLWLFLLCISYSEYAYSFDKWPKPAFFPFTKYLIHLSQSYSFPYCRPFWYSAIHATSFSFMKEKQNKINQAEIKQFASCIFQVWILSLDWYFTFCFTLNTFLYVFP